MGMKKLMAVMTVYKTCNVLILITMDMYMPTEIRNYPQSSMVNLDMSPLNS